MLLWFERFKARISLAKVLFMKLSNLEAKIYFLPRKPSRGWHCNKTANNCCHVGMMTSIELKWVYQWFHCYFCLSCQVETFNTACIHAQSSWWAWANDIWCWHITSHRTPSWLCWCRRDDWFDVSITLYDFCKYSWLNGYRWLTCFCRTLLVK